MSDRFTVILPPVLSEEDRAQEALKLCGGSLTEDDGSGDGYGDGGGCGWGSGWGDGWPLAAVAGAPGDGESSTRV